MSEPSDAEWEALEDARMYRNLEASYEDEVALFEERRKAWDDYRRNEIEWEKQREAADVERAAKILLTVIIVLLFLAVMFAAQTELNL